MKKRYFYQMQKRHDLKYLADAPTNEELRLSKKLGLLMENAERLMTFKKIAEDSYLKLKKTNFIVLKKNRDTDQINELVINFLSNGKLFVDYMDTSWIKHYIPDYYETWKQISSDMYDHEESYRLCYHLRNFVQHSGELPINEIKEKAKPDGKEKVDYILNIEAFKKFKNESKKMKIKDKYWNEDNLSFMKHATKYISILEGLYLLAMSEYIKSKKVELDKIQDQFEKSDFKCSIAWSYSSLEDIKDQAFELYPLVALPDLIRFYNTLVSQGVSI